MVEGPEYRRHAELLQLLVGRRLRRVLRARPALEAALTELLGLRVLRVFSVGKELFAVFESRRQIEVEDEALRLHLGESGGFVVAEGQALGWGPKSREKEEPQTTLEFNDLRFSLWDSLGSRYECCSPGYIKTVESRLCRDVSFEPFDLQSATALLRSNSMLLVDLIMNQAVLPGVGNIIKCEGLFGAGLHPLRRGTSLSSDEAARLVACLRDFAKRWFDNCRLSRGGAGMGCALPSCYGRSVCTRCRGELLLIKEGERRRLTFFCPACQVTETDACRLRPHRRSLPVGLPGCCCGRLPSVQLFRRPGKNFGRLHAVCPQRRHVQQPGCAGHHRMKLHPQGCNFLQWLDQARQNLHGHLPRCSCGTVCTLRRVMSMQRNGEIFARCAAKRCSFRVWIAPYQTSGEQRQPEDEAVPSSESAKPRPGRWRTAAGAPAPAQAQTKQGRTKNHPRPIVGELQVTGSVDSDEPLTSGEEEEEPEEELDARQWFRLLSLEESEQRLREARPPEAPAGYQKRWGRVKPGAEKAPRQALAEWAF